MSDTNTSATVNASAKSAKKAPAPIVSPLVAALTKALANASKAKPAKVFDEAAFRKDMAKHGLPSAFIESATVESKRKWEKEHGSNGEQITRDLLKTLAPSLGGIESLASVAGSMAKEAREAGKVKFTLSELEEETAEGVAEFVKTCAEQWDAGKQVSEIVESTSFYSYQTLANFIKSSPEIFTPRK